jgi:pyruvate dehydrogenase E1 component alpha subunit
MAAKKNGKGQVAIGFFGDGGVARGTFHEGAIMAANWKLPLVWVCENNQMVMLSSLKNVHPVQDIASLADGYGIPGVVVDGQDVFAVAEAVMAAVARARNGDGPTLIECKTHRTCEHAVGLPDMDGPELRTDECMGEFIERDPIKICRESLMGKGLLSQKEVEKIDRDAALEVEEAEKFATESPVADGSTLEGLLYAEA